MVKKIFSLEEILSLQASPYVLQVDCRFVHFSAQFKELFWNALQSGRKPRDAIIDLGIDPEILGMCRVLGLRGTIQREVKAGNGFRDLKTFNAFVLNNTDPEYRIKFLEQKLAYKVQEIAFLKKIVSLGQGVSEP